jgi:hypothetical protein
LHVILDGLCGLKGLDLLLCVGHLVGGGRERAYSVDGRSTA